MDDVWGNSKTGSEGMIVARSGQKCSVFGDEVPYKSVTVICDKEQYNDVAYWLEYVHGGGSIRKTKELNSGKIAIRSDYMCW